MTTGHRYGSAEALTAGLVDGVAAEDSVIDAALERLSAIAGKDKATIGAIKTTMFASVTAALRQGRQ